MIAEIKSVLSTNGEMTGLQLARALGTDASKLIHVLRKAVEEEELNERNGFYDRPHAGVNRPLRRSFNWVEGTAIPRWVCSLASGPKGCKTVFVMAEVNEQQQRCGWPQFIPALIDISLKYFVCCNTQRNISKGVLRYLPVDCSPVSQQIRGANNHAG